MSKVFPGKSRPTAEKLRGGYYTPPELASFVASWVSEAGPRTLEPSCGDGAILKELAAFGSPESVELVAAEARKATEASACDVFVGDFFEWFSEDSFGSFDGVAGNPPYIRFGNWDEQYRVPAFEFMRAEGLNPSRLTNAWLPFVVASIKACRIGGRIGLVLPAELLQVNYASELRSYIVDNCSEVNLVSFAELVFPGVLQEVVLLLAVRGEGPALMNAFQVDTYEDLSHRLLGVNLVLAPLHDGEKWTKYYLTRNELVALRELESSGAFRQFGDFGAVNVGVVTGRNSFFCLTSDEALELGIYSDTVGLLSRSAQLRSVTFTDSDLDDALSSGRKDRLLAIPKTRIIRPGEELEKYIAMGEAEGVHKGFKCSTRHPWWVVPSTQIPDGFMLRQISTSMFVASNETSATSTDTVHRVFLHSDVSMKKLAVATFNTVTRAFSEVLGRSYGGGLLEIEPREALRLPVPDPCLISDEMIVAMDELLRAGDERGAVKFVDEEVILANSLCAPEALQLADDAHRRLMGRRLRRGKS